MTATLAKEKRVKGVYRFYAESAERKGAKGVIELMQNSDSFCARESKRNWKVEFSNEDGDVTFTIYHNGAWAYDSPEQTIDGKLPPLHSRTWMRRMVKSGMNVEFARAEWCDFMGFHQGTRDTV